MTATKIIPEFAGYSVSEDGDVFTPSGRQLKPNPNRTGYLRVGIGRKTMSVHRLVAMAWIGPSPFHRACVAHMDGDRTNNHRRNLRWVTYTENESHKGMHGTKRIGRGCHAAKLDDQRVAALLARRREGISFPRLGREFGVSHHVAWGICTGKYWRHIDRTIKLPGETI